RRSTTVTSWPDSRRYQAVVVPITPAPRTRTFMAGAVWGFRITLSTLAGSVPTLRSAHPSPMRTRLYADLLGFLRAACTHASHAGREVPLIPFYVREHPVGWLRPSFAHQ